MRRLSCLLTAVSACWLILSGAVSGADNPKPRVLIIGDSISLGYTPYVVEMMGDKVEILHNQEPENAGDTGRGLESITSWIGDGKWDVIHFNWGLWDICHRVNGKRDLKGPISVELPEYEKNIEALVAKMKELAPGATLIWAPITNVTGGWGRVKGDDVKYNAAVLPVMQKHGVTVNDIHALTAEFTPELYASEGNVHFTGEGYKKIAEQVVASIEKALAGRAKK